MEWYQFLGLMITLYYFSRESKSIIENMQRDQRDFHGRLCALEEKYIQMMEKFINNRSKK